MNSTVRTNEIPTSDDLVTPVPGLADPAERPDANIVIFDGNCRFCQKQVKRLNRFDGGNRLAFISLHDPRIESIVPDLTHEQMMEQMYVVSPEGATYGGAAAIRFLSRKLPALWWIAPLMHIPFTLPIWQWGYLQIAARRYRLSQDSQNGCEEDACRIHLPG